MLHQKSIFWMWIYCKRKATYKSYLLLNLDVKSHKKRIERENSMLNGIAHIFHSAKKKINAICVLFCMWALLGVMLWFNLPFFLVTFNVPKYNELKAAHVWLFILCFTFLSVFSHRSASRNPKKITLLFPKHRIKVAISHTVSLQSTCQNLTTFALHEFFFKVFSIEIVYSNCANQPKYP